MNGFIVYSDYIENEDKSFIQLFGRLQNGKSFMSLHNFQPYFFIRESDFKSKKPLFKKYQISKDKSKNFKGDNVTRISSDSIRELNKLSSHLHSIKIDTYEADVKPAMRFLMDNDILGLINIKGDYEASEKVDRYYENPEIEPITLDDFKPNLKIISLDIETSHTTGELYCIGLCSKNYEKVFLISNKKSIPNTIICNNEWELLTKFKEEIVKQDPDIITGWNVIDFDFSYLKNKFLEHNITFDLGRTNKNPRIRISEGFFRSSQADISGRQVLDGLNLLRDPFIKEAPSIKHLKISSFTLENASQAILGEGKLLKGRDRKNEIERLFKEDPRKLVEYNLKDCRLAYDIIDKTQTISLAIERSTLTGLPLSRITGSIASFDSLYIREARKRNLVSPTTRFGEKERPITGGYVMESKPGIFHNLIVLDFKSLYPSIIRTFNIDPASYLEVKEKNAIESPNKAYFKNQDGILPQIIDKLHRAREKAKKEKRELASYSIKIIMNSFFGVLASPNCRYFSLEIAILILAGLAVFVIFLIKRIQENEDSKGISSLHRNKGNLPEFDFSG